METKLETLVDKVDFENLYQELAKHFPKETKFDLPLDKKEFDKLSKEEQTLIEKILIFGALSGQETERPYCKRLIESGVIYGEQVDFLELEISTLATDKRLVTHVLKTLMGTSYNAESKFCQVFLNGGILHKKLRWSMFLNPKDFAFFQKLFVYVVLQTMFYTCIDFLVCRLRDLNIMVKTRSILKSILDRKELCTKFASSRLKETTSFSTTDVSVIFQEAMEMELAFIEEYLVGDSKNETLKKSLQIKLGDKIQSIMNDIGYEFFPQNKTTFNSLIDNLTKLDILT